MLFQIRIRQTLLAQIPQRPFSFLSKLNLRLAACQRLAPDSPGVDWIAVTELSAK